MPLKINLSSAPRALAYRTSKPTYLQSRIGNPTLCRSYASDQGKGLPKAEGEEPVGPNMNQGEHVSEEAAKMAQMTGGSGPDLSVGTPVQDVRSSKFVYSYGRLVD